MYAGSSPRTHLLSELCSTCFDGTDEQKFGGINSLIHVSVAYNVSLIYLALIIMTYSGFQRGPESDSTDNYC